MSLERRPPARSRARPQAPITALISALITAVLGLGILVATEPAVGITRDEGIYMVASRRYGRWLRDVGRGLVSPLDGDVETRPSDETGEHPDLMKIASGLASWSSPRPGPRRRRLPWTGRGPGDLQRPPAPRHAAGGPGLGAARLGGRGPDHTHHGRRGRPRSARAAAMVFSRALHCFDVPIAVWIFAVVVCWHRARTSRPAAVGVGVLMGLAIGTKHNALFVVPLLILDELAQLWLRWRATRTRPSPSALLSWRLASVCILGPLIALATWPWLWSAPIDRLGEYLAFHREHAYYNMELLGTNYNEPPMPVAYPFVMTAATVPWSLLAAATLGATLMVRDDLRGDRLDRERRGRPPTLGLTTVVFAGFPILLIALPFVPIFGGTKHWITAYPFLMVLAAVGLHRCMSLAALTGRTRALAAAAVPLLLFAPAAPPQSPGTPTGSLSTGAWSAARAVARRWAQPRFLGMRRPAPARPLHRSLLHRRSRRASPRDAPVST